MRNVFIFFIAIICFSSCSSIKITSDKDGTVDFDRHTTLSYYGWQEDSDKILNSLERERIEQAFGKEFAKRGITVTERDGDIIVSLFIVVDQKKGAKAYTNHYGGGGPYGWYGGYGAGWGWGMGYSTTTYHEYDYSVGTLVCDVFDSKTKKLIWQGVVSGEIDDNPKTRERNIPKVVKELMKRYPKKPIRKK
ncbi:MAG: DUF4136 domain-containing protein [Cytophagales bacterium]|nr:DUF4136 domain-containing protein [Cytophagales bacterium]